MMPESSMPAPVPEGPLEVEQKYRVAAHEEIVLALHRLGACEHPMEFQSDRYLRHPCRDFATTGEAFRLRQVNDQRVVTYKGPRLTGPMKTRIEIEIGLAPDTAQGWDQLWSILGFQEVLEVRKQRRVFSLKDPPNTLHIALDNVEALGLFVEIEVMVHDRSRLEEAQAQIASLASKLHLTEVEPRSYLRQLLPSGM